MDIGDILDFKPKACTSDGTTKISIKGILNRPVTVVRWRSLKSRFHETNPSGMFVELLIDMDGELYIVNTGSTVIMDQLDEIAKRQPDQPQFSCVFKNLGQFYKMFPCTEEQK